MPGLVPCLGNGRIAIRKAAVQALQVKETSFSYQSHLTVIRLHRNGKLRQVSIFVM
jgi:hypothetical protein